MSGSSENFCGHVADLAARAAAADLHAAARGGWSPRITLNRVVLPAPFGADQAGELALADREADVVEDRASAQPNGDPVDGERLRGARRGSHRDRHVSRSVETRGRPPARALAPRRASTTGSCSRAPASSRTRRPPGSRCFRAAARNVWVSESVTCWL